MPGGSLRRSVTADTAVTKLRIFQASLYQQLPDDYSRKEFKDRLLLCDIDHLLTRLLSIYI